MHRPGGHVALEAGRPASGERAVWVVDDGSAVLPMPMPAGGVVAAVRAGRLRAVR